MGIGKTTVSQILKRRLPACAFLDGDWCWDMDPFQVCEETKKMEIDNICYVLNNFLKCSVYENVVFCWVMHEQSIIDEITARLKTENVKVTIISLICSKESLIRHLQKDIDAGIRTDDVIQRSVNRLPFYVKLNTKKIDVSKLSVEQGADKII